MQSNDRFAEFNQKVLATIEQQLGVAGKRGVDFAQFLVDKPVEYANGRVIRSRVGESPRKETGALQAGIKSDVDRIGSNAVELTFSTSRNGDVSVPRYLERGEGARGKRPYMRPAMERSIKPDLRTKMVDALRKVR